MIGRGLHTGEECRIEITPAEPDSGIVFISKGEEIAAVIANVRDTNRGTTLHKAGAEVHTVEHLLAALAAMSVDNTRVRVEGDEIPAADGSALPFVELIEEAGTVGQRCELRPGRLDVPIWAMDGAKCLIAVPGEGFRVSCLISFQHRLIGEQAFSARIDAETFKREIAPARTFCTSDEIAAILARGLGKGGNEENVIVVGEDGYSTALRFPDEFVRHKVLDLIGDLALVGRRL
jgi:UDP-3-O-acyl N-acetylglucosamine deacetylase